MRIAILLADEMRDALKPKFCCYANMFKALLWDYHFSVMDVFDIRDGIYPDKITDYDGYLITGSRHGVYDSLPWLNMLFEYINRLESTRIPLVGICFGHQAIAHALGGKVEKSVKGWGVGRQEWDIYDLESWMQPPLTHLRLFAHHQDQVVENPDKAKILAGSIFCSNAVFSIDTYVFCIQGHPEFSAEFSNALLDYRHDDMPEDAIKTATHSALLPVDNSICSRWIGNFFMQAKRGY